MIGEITRPVLRYHGGKFKIAKWIISHFPEHEIYVEPFCGAASILMAKRRSAIEIINDADDRIARLFVVLRDPDKAARLKRLCELTPFSRFELRRAYDVTGDDVEDSRRLLAASFMGIGTQAINISTTGFAYSSKTGTSSAETWAAWPRAIRQFTARLKGVVIENVDAITLINRLDDPNALIYCDPPYVSATRTDGGSQYRHEMSDDDHIALARTLHDAKGIVALSGYDSGLYAELYASWAKATKGTRATGNPINGDQPKRVECLWLNPAATARSTGRLF